MKKIILALCMLSTAEVIAAQELPPNPYESWGVCPFECCTYREWTADADIDVHEKRGEQSRILYRLYAGERVDVLTGVVVTRNPAPIRINRAINDGFTKDSERPLLSFKPGDVIYMVAPLGEGFYLFWYQGKVYRSGIELAAMPGVEGKGMTLTWWKQVRNRTGQIGWTQSDHFQNADACG